METAQRPRRSSTAAFGAGRSPFAVYVFSELETRLERARRYCCANKCVAIAARGQFRKLVRDAGCKSVRRLVLKCDIHRPYVCHEIHNTSRYMIED